MARFFLSMYDSHPDGHTYNTSGCLLVLVASHAKL